MNPGIMRAEHDTGAALITFNGSHDMSVLRRRAARHWLFPLYAFDGWPTRPGGRHLDMMRLDPAGDGGRLPSLVDACAGFGINAICEASGRRTNLLHGPTRKNQVDVVATALLLFHHLSIRARSPDPLARGWAALARHLRAEHRGATHLSQFSEHPYARVAARLEARLAGG